MTVLLLYFADYASPARKLAQLLRIECAEVISHTFPDGENKLTLPVEIPNHVIICRSLNDPDRKLVELYLVVQALRAQGCSQVDLVLPYLCYMRQDIAFQPGEIVSQRWIGKYLDDIADTIITVDPHLHRTNELSEVFPSCRSVALSAAPLLGDLIISQTHNPLLLGPDEESLQWVEQIGVHTGLEFAIARKSRFGDRDVEIDLPDVNFTDRDIILTDDIASTGHTLLKTIKVLHKHDVNSIYCAVTHGIFAENAYQLLKQQGVKGIFSTDSVIHPSNRVELAPLLSTALEL